MTVKQLKDALASQKDDELVKGYVIDENGNFILSEVESIGSEPNEPAVVLYFKDITT